MPGGSTTVNFGAFQAAPAGAPSGPEGGDLVINITGQGAILPSSLVEAWLLPVATSDHSVDEHFVENIHVRAGNIVNGVGFDIHAECKLGGTYGLFTVGWAWV